MTWVARLHARRAGRTQEGFALATTIAILLVTSMLITALLGLSFATSEYAAGQIRRDKETRAAEAALEPAAAILARANPPCGELNSQSCDDSPNLKGILRGQVYDKSVLTDPATGFTVSYDDACNWQPNAATGETESSRPPLVGDINARAPGLADAANNKFVEVFCTALPAERFAPEVRTDSVVKLIGKVPTGSWQSATTSPCRPLQTTPECLPWAEALSTAGITGQNANVAATFGPAGTTRNGASLVHSGPNALQVVGDLDVTGGAAVLRNSLRGSSNAFVAEGPAMALSGAYRQGDPGPLATSANRCGLLVDPADVANTGGATPVVSTTTTTVPAGSPNPVPSAQISAGVSPICDQTLLRTDVVTKAGVVPAPAFPWTPKLVRDNDRTTTQLPQVSTGGAYSPLPSWGTGSCPVGPGGVVRFSPGAYPANLTLRINQWFANCAGVKFWFAPASVSPTGTGYYWFDVSEADGSALKMERTSNFYVFGTPNAGSQAQPNANVVTRNTQPLCNSEWAGINMTLSPRTVIRHRGGYVGICGDRNSTTRQAIWQEPTANLGFQQVSPTTFTGATTSATWYDSLRNIFLIGSLVNLFFPASNVQNRYFTLPNGGVAMTANCSSAPCNGSAGFATTWTPPAGSDPGRATVNSATLRISGNTINANDVWNGPTPATEVALFKPNAAGTLPATPTCRVVAPRVNDTYGRNASPLVVDVDLFYPGSPCGTSIDRSDLLRSRIEVIMGLNSNCDILQVFTGCTYGVQIDSLKLVTPQVLAPPAESLPTSTAPSGQSAQTNGSAAAVLAADNSAVQFQWNSYRSGCVGPVIFGVCIGVPIFRVADSGSSTVRLPNLTDRYEPSVSDSDPSVDGTLTSANLRVKGVSSCDNWHILDVVLVSRIDCRDYNAANNPGAKLRVAVTRSGAPVCTAQFDFLPEWNQTRSYDLLNSCVQGGVKRLRFNKDLIGVDLDVTFDMVRDKSLNYGCRNIGDFPGNGCNWFRYAVDYIGLQTTVATSANQAWDGPGAQALVTSNDFPGAQREGRFNVYGATVMPRTDMRVDWVGPANKSGEPVFNGPPAQGNARPNALVLGSLYSYMSPTAGQNPNSVADDPQAGIICCSSARPAERMVELRAHTVPTDRFKLPLKDTPVPNLSLAAQQVENATNCADDHPEALPFPAAVASASPALKAQWRAVVVRDWNTRCRVETLRAVSKVRVLDQIPPDVSPLTVSADVYDRRGSWVPGWDYEVMDFRFCQGGANGTTVCGDQ